MNICVSIGNCSKKELVHKLKETELAEIRLDLLDWITASDIKEIFSSHNNLIATFRPGKISEKERLEFLKTAIEAGAAFIDVETENTAEFISEVVKTARRHGTKIIISYHDHENTPSLKPLQKIVVDALGKGADIVKVACKVNSERDCARLLSLLDGKRTVIPVGMGKKGFVTRISGLFLGAPFTYAGFEHDPEMIKRIISEISDA